MINHSISPAGVNLDIHSGPIGVSCSGGADSSILLYHLMREKEDKIHIFTTGNNQRSRYNVTCATAVVEKIIQLTGNTNIEHHISYCEVQSRETLFPKLKVYLDSKTTGIIYTGITANPPKDITDTFKLPVSQTNRSPEDKHPHMQRNNTFYTPWVNVNKLKIAEMYKESNLLDALYPITRSCEYDPTNNYFNDIEDPATGHCGECWWCEERKWAFGRLE